MRSSGWVERNSPAAPTRSAGVRRGTQILVAESPQGPFHPWSDKPVPPFDWECLDGTLFVTPEGDLWMVFSHEWVQVGDGEICAILIKKDLTSAKGKPILLFHASQAPWVRQLNSKGRKGYVTDGPWLHRLPGGELLLLWSSHSESGYTIGVARSVSGQLLGPWQQDAEPLYSGDGGHCMTFRDLNGNFWVSLHHPDETPYERPMFLPLAEEELVSPRRLVRVGM